MKETFVVAGKMLPEETESFLKHSLGVWQSGYLY